MHAAFALIRAKRAGKTLYKTKAEKPSALNQKRSSGLISRQLLDRPSNQKGHDQPQLLK